MRNRDIILTATLSLLGCGWLSCTALAAGPPTVDANVVNTPNVNVVNTTTNPVPVTGTVGVADPAHQAVQQELNLLGGPGSNVITIPVGKIFVLETVSFVFISSFTLDALSITVTDSSITGGGPVPAAYFLVIPPPIANGIIQGSQPLRLYAQPGTTLKVNFGEFGSSGQNTEFEVALSGYLVNAP